MLGQCGLDSGASQVDFIVRAGTDEGTKGQLREVMRTTVSSWRCFLFFGFQLGGRPAGHSAVVSNAWIVARMYLITCHHSNDAPGYACNYQTERERVTYCLFCPSSALSAFVGGGGRSSIGAVPGGDNSVGLGGLLSNSAIGAISGIGATEFKSIRRTHYFFIILSTHWGEKKNWNEESCCCKSCGSIAL